MLHARFGDYVIAIGSAPASVPLIGRHFEPVGGMAALGVWAARYLPDFVAARKARYSPDPDRLREDERIRTAAYARDALRELVSPAELEAEWPLPRQYAPFLSVVAQRKYVYRTSIRYGRNAGQLLDVWRRHDLPETAAPVLIFVPGGAWVFGSRLVQGHELMARLAAMGWVCLSVQYGTSPRHRWPRQIADVKAAIAWARGNVGRFGGDQDFIAIAGCSAGGHLATLAGLTANDPEWARDLPPGADTSVDAVASVYGRYDWEDRSSAERARFMDFLERVVVKRSQVKRPDIFRRASPLARITGEAPPFLIIHGSRDAVIPIAEARTFAQRLREASPQPVCYLELPGAGHGFDLVDGARTSAAVHAISLFLNHIRGNRPNTPLGEVI